jgi:glutamyl-tRNA synthetase
MAISHVIRGADHISNTPKQILLHQALGNEAPVYAHLPLILGPDKKRLSKRNGAESVLEYRNHGFLPAALSNYLALLGWSPGGDRELLDGPELVSSFSLDRVNKANAVFDRQKLDWMNSRYMADSDSHELSRHLRPFIQGSGISPKPGRDNDDRELLPVITLLKSRLNRLSDFPEMAKPFLTDRFDYEEGAIQRHLMPEDPEGRSRLRHWLSALAVEYDRLEEFNPATVEQVMRSTAKASGFKIGAFFGAVRVALTGRTAAPGIFDVVVTLGRQRVVERLNRCLQILQ